MFLFALLVLLVFFLVVRYALMYAGNGIMAPMMDTSNFINYVSMPVPFNGISSSSRAPVRRCLIAGTNYTRAKGNVALSGCVEDAKNAISLVQAQYTATEVTVIPMSDEKGQSPEYTTTRKQLLRALREELIGPKEKLQPGDELWFHFSGHGVQIPSTKVRGATTECIVPLDFEEAGFITSDDLIETLLVPLHDTGVRLIVTLDCCHSGTNLRLPYNLGLNSDMSTLAAPEPDDQPAVRNLNVNVTYLGACANSETAADMTTGRSVLSQLRRASASARGVVGHRGSGKAYGALSYSLFSIMRQKPRGKVSISQRDLLLHLGKSMRDMGIKQHPQLSSMHPVKEHDPFRLLT